MKTVFSIAGIYYLITAIWPLVSIRTFEKVSGPKIDKWLVYTVSLLLLGPSLLYLYSGFSDSEVHNSIIFLALINAIALTFIDVYFSFKKVIWKTYLIDAVLQILIMVALIISLF